MAAPTPIKIGIIGGTGLDNPNLLKDRVEKFVETPFGTPSDALICGKIHGVDCVMLARHDREHKINPTSINFRANLWALKEEGVNLILASTACGSLREHIHPRELVILDQGIDRTTMRHSTFYDNTPNGPVGVCHISLADPFHERLRRVLYETAQELNIPCHPRGTVVTIEGPRFSTRAESNMFRAWGGDVINMTTFPEVTLAQEAGIPYAAVAMATDYDCWHEEEEDVSVQAVLQTMKQNAHNTKELFIATVAKISAMDWSNDISAAQDKVNSSVLMPKAIEIALESVE